MLCLNAMKSVTEKRTNANHTVTDGEKFSSPPVACGCGFHAIYQEREFSKTQMGG